MAGRCGRFAGLWQRSCSNRHWAGRALDCGKPDPTLGALPSVLCGHAAIAEKSPAWLHAQPLVGPRALTGLPKDLVFLPTLASVRLGRKGSLTFASRGHFDFD